MKTALKWANAPQKNDLQNNILSPLFTVSCKNQYFVTPFHMFWIRTKNKVVSEGWSQHLAGEVVSHLGDGPVLFMTSKGGKGDKNRSRGRTFLISGLVSSLEGSQVIVGKQNSAQQTSCVAR